MQQTACTLAGVDDDTVGMKDYYPLTLNYYLFLQITNFTRNFLRKSFFPGHFEGAKILKNYQNNSQGIIFKIISFRRANHRGNLNRALLIGLESR